MANPRIYAFAEPENDGERRVISYLDQKLPPEFRIYHTMERHGGSQTYEWDILVLAPHALFCLEIKDWPGHIVGNDRDWLLNNGAIRRNPYPLIARKARILKNILLERDAFLKSVWVEPLVVIADERTELSISGNCASAIVTLKDIIPRLTDQSDQKWIGRDHRGRFDDVEKILTKDFRPATSSQEIAQFRLLEQLGATDLFTEWRAENRFAAMPLPVRLKVYDPDPYLPSPQREEQLLLVRRDFEAAMRMGSHPNISAARDFFPDEGGRYVLVLDELPGNSLAADLLSGCSLTFERKLKVVEDIAAGLGHAHSRKIIHRDVRPGNIWLTPTGAVLVNFDYARIGNGNTIRAMVEAGLDPQYLAPEVRASASAATSASDVFALGIVMYELLTGHFPQSDLNVQAPSKFDPLVDPDLDNLVQRMIAFDPTARPSAAEVCDLLAHLREQRRSPTQTPAGGTNANTDQTPDFTVGDKIEGQYLVRGLLGEGSFGKVYRVYSAVTDREYAMKLFRDPGLGLDDAQKEFGALAELSHPRIARVWHAGLLRQGTCYLLTDCIEGRPLQQLLGANRPGPMDAIRIIRDLLNALGYLHSRGYVHRDIKPSNIIVSTSGAWLIDFSIAAPATSEATDKAGTPLYTPPDASTCGLRPSRDLFAAGVVLYELLTGHHPYDGPPRKGLVPRDPLVDEPQLSDSVARILRRTVAADAADRYAAADEMLADLDAVEEPLRPLQPEYPLVEGITITNEERATPSYNPYLTRFLTLYSQNRTDNSGTRGYDEVSRATYVRTRLDKRLAPDILQSKFDLVIITGNAGDGKTAFLQSLEEEIAKGTGHQPPPVVTRLPSGNGATFVLANRKFRTNYDGSQNEGDLQNDDALADFFEPFSGTAEEIANRSANVSRLIAINEGKLRDFLVRREKDFPWLANAVEAHLEGGHPLPDGYLIVNLNDRSVVAGENTVLDQQIKAFCNPAFWVPCRCCDYASRCSVKFNMDTLNDPDLGPRVRDRLGRLFEIAHLRGQIHLTMRGVRSALAYILFGKDDCGAIISQLEARNPDVNHEEQLLGKYYYNAIVADGSIGGADGAYSEETDRLLRFLSEADVGQGANPSDDRDLHFNGVLRSPLLPLVSGRSDYDRDLLLAMMERLESIPFDNEARVSSLRLHGMLRRKSFFERPDDCWEMMLPFSLLPEILRACKGDETALKRLKTDVVSGINHGEGLGDISDALVLRLARGVPGRVRSFRQFPLSDFVLRPTRPVTSSVYVEYSPSCLELVYRPGMNGSSSGRPTLRLGLELIELLSRMSRGYAPTAAEWRGPLVNLLVFRTLLAHEEYDQLVLIDSLQERRFRVKQNGTQIILSTEEEVNAAN